MCNNPNVNDGNGTLWDITGTIDNETWNDWCEMWDEFSEQEGNKEESE